MKVLIGEPIAPPSRGMRSPRSFCERLADRAERARQRRFEIASTTEGTVYLIGAKRGPVKIGLTNNLGARLSRLQMNCPLPLSVLASVAGTRKDELKLHQRFRNYRLHGEWFERCPEIEAEIARLCAPTQSHKGGNRNGGQ